MWCKGCREDVPALPSSDKPGFCCARCGQSIQADSTNAPDAALGYDGWELDEQLRHIDRVLHPKQTNDAQNDELVRREASRFDLPHAAAAPWHVPTAPRSPRKPAKPTAERGSFVGTMAWIALSLGTASFVGGAILLGWSLFSGRQELWNAGLPMALGGQVALLIGLVLQLDRLWHDSRSAVVKLDSVDEQLHELKATTSMLGVTHGPAASEFYSHYAGGAGAKVLLTDLKSQIDLLAMKIAREE